MTNPVPSVDASAPTRDAIAESLRAAWRHRARVPGPLGLWSAPPDAAAVERAAEPVLANFLMHSALHLSPGSAPPGALSPCLTAAELADVTGKERPSAQIGRAHV